MQLCIYLLPQASCCTKGKVCLVTQLSEKYTPRLVILRTTKTSSIFETSWILEFWQRTWRGCQLNLISKGPQVALASIPYLQDSPKHSNSSHKHYCFWENSQHPTFIFSDRKWCVIPLMLIFPLPYMCTLLKIKKRKPPNWFHIFIESKKLKFVCPLVQYKELTL